VAPGIAALWVSTMVPWTVAVDCAWSGGANRKMAAIRAKSRTIMFLFI
jgi:hypothetical protein